MARYPGVATVRPAGVETGRSPGVALVRSPVVALVRYDRWRTVLGGEVAVP
jgi:hypothetical protein